MSIDELRRFEGIAPFGSLQQGAEAPFEMPRIYGPDMGATASVISALELVVTVDTAVAHLAGALGKECWLIAPKNGEWRWGIEGPRTPWYNSIEIFRCPDGDRALQIEAVTTRLRQRYS